jgi:threonine aldolase
MNDNHFSDIQTNKKIAYSPYKHELIYNEIAIRKYISAELSKMNLFELKREKLPIFPFYSDTGASISPEVVLQRIASEELLRVTGFNGYIEKERESVAGLFKSDKLKMMPLVFFTSSTTQANKLSLVSASDIQPIKGDIALASIHSHIFSFEVSQPAEPIKPKDEIQGKITTEDLDIELKEYQKIGRRVKLIHLDQPTKGDFFYSPQEIKKITEWAHKRKIAVSMDVERLVGYLANNNLNYKDFTSDCGVDIVTLGMQKNGGARSSAIIILNTDYLPNKKDLTRRLDSFQRFIGNITDNPLSIITGWEEMIETKLYLKNASKANTQSNKVAKAIIELGKDFEFQNYPLTTNMIFVKIPKEFIEKFNSIKDGVYFHPDRYGVTRIVTAHDTSDQDVEYLIKKINAVSKDKIDLFEPSDEIEKDRFSLKNDKDIFYNLENLINKSISFNTENTSFLKLSSENAKLKDIITNTINESFLFHAPYGQDKITMSSKTVVKKLFDKENDYLKEWDIEKKKSMITQVNYIVTSDNEKPGTPYDPMKDGKAEI